MHDFIKISLLRTYIATHKLDVISLSETCRCCIFYRNSLPIQALGVQYLQEWINFEYFDFEVFTNNFELNIYTATANNTILTVAFGDFNAKSNL